MTVNGEPQVVIIIDDITDRFSKDYHASILTHLSETMGEEVETETTFYNITCRGYIGFRAWIQRAMLFMVNEDILEGKMAVGPDSFDEAIEIWNSLSSSDTDLTVQYPIEIKRGTS
jgi:hypothetical protein